MKAVKKFSDLLEIPNITDRYEYIVDYCVSLSSNEALEILKLINDPKTLLHSKFEEAFKFPSKYIPASLDFKSYSLKAQIRIFLVTCAITEEIYKKQLYPPFLFWGLTKMQINELLYGEIIYIFDKVEPLTKSGKVQNNFFLTPELRKQLILGPGFLARFATVKSAMSAALSMVYTDKRIDDLKKELKKNDDWFLDLLLDLIPFMGGKIVKNLLLKTGSVEKILDVLTDPKIDSKVINIIRTNDKLSESVYSLLSDEGKLEWLVSKPFKIGKNYAKDKLKEKEGKVSNKSELMNFLLEYYLSINDALDTYYQDIIDSYDETTGKPLPSAKPSKQFRRILNDNDIVSFIGIINQFREPSFLGETFKGYIELYDKQIKPIGRSTYERLIDTTMAPVMGGTPVFTPTAVSLPEPRYIVPMWIKVQRYVFLAAVEFRFIGNNYDSGKIVYFFYNEFAALYAVEKARAIQGLLNERKGLFDPFKEFNYPEDFLSSDTDPTLKKDKLFIANIKWIDYIFKNKHFYYYKILN